MKIDLHCHTKKTKEGDGAKRNVSAAVFASSLESAGVEIAAITNHNHFDIHQFHEFQVACSGIAQLWPGIELDVRGSRDGSHWHLIVVANPKQLELFDSTVTTLIGDVDPNCLLLRFDEVFSAFTDLDSIFVSHCHQKDPFATTADIEEMASAMTEGWRLFYEPRNLTTVGIWSNHGWNMLLGSDVKDWNNYPGKELPELRLPVSSFDQFYLLARRDGTTIATLLNNRPVRTVVAHPSSGVDVQILLYEEINVFFGQKGTGKTRIVKSIEAALQSQGMRCSSYYGGEKEGAFKEVLSPAKLSGSMASLKRDAGEADIDFICKWSESKATPMEDYVRWQMTKDNSRKKRGFRISNSTSLIPAHPLTYANAKRELEEARRLKTSYLTADLGKFLDADERMLFETMLDKIEARSLDCARSAFIEAEAIRLANDGIEAIKREIDAKSETKSIPSSTGFLRFALGRIELAMTAERLAEGLSECESVEREYLGTLDDKGRLDLVTAFRVLCANSRTSEFEKGITALRDWKTKLEAVQASALGSDAAVNAEAFKRAVDETGITSLDEFVGARRFIALHDSGAPYEPSNGEQGILLLERRLNEDADVYVLDEPEAGMSNSYVDAVVRPKVQSLARAGKTVVMATHNANLAVRTLPYASFYRRHNNGRYSTFAGNPFADQLVEVESGETIGWSECSMTTLEGGEEAFYDRKNIYEAGIHE